MSDVSELVKRLDHACNNKSPFWPHKVLRDCRDALTAQQAEIERLREALEPFAKALDDHDAEDKSISDKASIWETPAAMDITYGDLRHARAALTGKEGEDG